MSSSRIIKSGQPVERSVAPFAYGNLGVQRGTPLLHGSVEGFTPLQLVDGTSRGPAGQAGSSGEGSLAVLEAEPVSEGLRCIADEELTRQLEESFGRGFDEGRRQAERGLANAFKSLREGIAAVSELREKVLRESEDDLLKLAMLVAKKIVHQEIRQDPQILANIIAAAVSDLASNDRISIRLNPDDLQLVQQNRHLYLAGIGSDEQIALIADEGILVGGCMVDTVTGTVDARVEIQLEEIYHRFLEERSLPGELPLALLEEGAHAFPAS